MSEMFLITGKHEGKKIRISKQFRESKKRIPQWKDTDELLFLRLEEGEFITNIFDPVMDASVLIGGYI